MPYALHLFDHSDNWVGTARALPARVRSMGEGYTYTTRLTLPSGLTRKQRIQARDAAEATMRWSCHCEHDCCGCSFGYSRAQIINARTLSVLTSVGYNV